MVSQNFHGSPNRRRLSGAYFSDESQIRIARPARRGCHCGGPFGCSAALVLTPLAIAKYLQILKASWMRRIKFKVNPIDEVIRKVRTRINVA
jgi:hypothetical protein